MILYFEGSETSAMALAFAIYELANNPDVQDRLYSEVCETPVESNSQLSFETLHSMKYLENIFSEAIRLHSPVLYMSKLCTRKYILPEIGNNAPVTIFPGTIIEVPVRALLLWVLISDSLTPEARFSCN